jgi:hypothetical protein
MSARRFCDTAGEAVMESKIDPRLRDALEELDSYLGDRLAPALVADSVEVLLEYRPELTAEVLKSWAAAQYQARSGELPISDLLFHALKKLQILEELKLLPAESFTAFLREIAARLIALCPAAERERLETSLKFLTESRRSAGASLEHLHRAVGDAPLTSRSTAATVAQLSPEAERGLRRFSLWLDRALPAVREAGGPVTPDLAGQMLVLAAADAASAADLEERIARLQAAGIGPAVARDLVGTLAESIPDWVIRRDRSVEAYRGGTVAAVRKVVQLAGDRARAAERWKELLSAAAKQFNLGAHGRAVTLIDLADRMALDGEVDARVAEIARGAGHEGFETAALLQATAEAQNQPVLRRLVEFFPAWSVRQLLDDLHFQPDQKRRRLVLALIEVWGLDAREAVFDRLVATVSTAGGDRDPNAWWFLRNLVYLLHRLPRAPEDDGRRELEIVAPFSQIAHHPSFQREAFQLLAQLPAGIGSQLLIQRLREAERALEGTAPPPHDVQEMWKVLHALAAALVRVGTPAARRALVEHGLAARPRAGDSAARLRELARTDLRGDPELVERLLGALRSLLPVKLLGFVVARNEETLAHVVVALSATTTPEVRAALAEITHRFPDREFGQLAAGGTIEGPVPEVAALAPGAAARAREPLAPESSVAAAPRVSLAGDLEVFGLAGLLQTLQQSETSGRLVLRDATGRERASFELEKGGLVDCRAGRLTGESAFYQLFEVPAPGTFELVRLPAEGSTARPKLDLMGLLMESMRRYDELQRARLLVPDTTPLVASIGKPSAPEGETDGDLLRRLWTAVRGGTTAVACEAEADVDSYRVRAVLAHWIEEGAAAFSELDPTPAH